MEIWIIEVLLYIYSYLTIYIVYVSIRMYVCMLRGNIQYIHTYIYIYRQIIELLYSFR